MTARQKEAARKLRVYIRQQNKKFAGMSKAEKRVAIAEDVLLQLRSRKIHPLSGTGYVYAQVKGEVSPDRQVQDALVDGQLTSCEVCGIGALFTGGARLFDQVTCKDGLVPNEAEYILDGDSVRRYLGRWFSLDQLDAIESAFETYRRHDDPAFDDAAGFGKRYDNDNDRLCAIMKNIIANKGTFRPERQPA